MLCSYPLDRYSLSKQIDLTSADMMLTIKSFYKKSITVHDDDASSYHRSSEQLYISSSDLK